MRLSLDYCYNMRGWTKIKKEHLLIECADQNIVDYDMQQEQQVLSVSHDIHEISDRCIKHNLSQRDK